MLATGNISPSQLPSGSVQVCQETQSTISCSPSIIVIVHSKLDPGRLFYCRCGWQRLKWLLAGSPQVAKAGRRQKRCAMAWRTGEGPSDKGWPWNLSWHRHHFENSPFGFCCFRFSLLSLTQGKYKTFGGMSLLEWKSRWEKGRKGGWEIAILS